jgi:anti-sigma regulatory factor (Ser/Thr protein kinase)
MHPIHVTFRHVKGHIEMEFEDRGREFNPLEIGEPDLDSPIENRQLGGLGIHLVRKMMDEAKYRREGDRNILMLRKAKATPTTTP